VSPKIPRVVHTQRDVGRQVSRQDRLVALVDNAWANQVLGGEEGRGHVLGLGDGVAMLTVLEFRATCYAHLTVLPNRQNPCSRMRG
jgi:hypothetical protein